MENYFQNMPTDIRSYILKKAHNKIIFLPEGEDKRIIEASKILKSNFNVSVILGNKDSSQRNKSKTLEVMTKTAQKKSKIMTPEQEKNAEDPTYEGGALLELGEVHAVVSGCQKTTAHVIRAALNTIGLASHSKLITSCFLFSLQKPTQGGEQIILYSDCAVIPKPTSEELVNIAHLSCQAFTHWTNKTPKVSFLSFSTKGSASHPDVEKVAEAAELFTQNYPTISSDGEVQFDTAIVPSISERKNLQSKIKGQTNVFIFPDLDAGNIAYKITQHIGSAEAWGPILLGTAKPFSDLSRGSSVSDIVHTSLLSLASN